MMQEHVCTEWLSANISLNCLKPLIFPTEKQMKQLQDFLHQMFGEEYAQSEEKQEGMAA